MTTGNKIVCPLKVAIKLRQMGVPQQSNWYWRYETEPVDPDRPERELTNQWHEDNDYAYCVSAFDFYELAGIIKQLQTL